MVADDARDAKEDGNGQIADCSSGRVQLTIQINAPDHALDQELFPLDLAATATVKDLKSMVNQGTGLAIENIQFYLNGQPLATDTQTLEAAGVKDGELLAMLVRDDTMTQRGTRPQQQQRPARGGQQQQQRAAGMSNEQIETIRLRILGNAGAVQQVSQQHPEMGTAVHDPARFRELYIRMQREENERESERIQQMQLLNEDPFNVEAQAKIEEMIRQDRVMENLQYAYEHNPEGELCCQIVV